MGNIKCCLVICLTLSLFLLFLPLHTYASQSPPTIYTIQTASLIDVTHAQEQFDSITQQLNEKELDHLRIEKIGKFYSVRLGKFENRATAEKFLQVIKPQLPTAIIMKAYIIDERIVKLYKGSSSVEDYSVEEKPLSSKVPQIVYAESSEGRYTVKIGDVLSIKVINYAGLGITANVAVDGTITFPYIGAVYVEGMKISEIEKEITKRLSEGYLEYPVVSAALVRAVGETFYVYGEAGRRGSFTLDKDMTVLRAISKIGGIGESGRYGKVKVRRKQEGKPGYKDIEIDFKGIIEGRVTDDMLLQPDDILIVERNKTFFIQGEVRAPGEYVLADDITVTRAITIAGGIRESGLYGRVKVRRKREEGPGYRDIEIDFKGIIEGRVTDDMLLQPDDILIVERNKTFFIQGEVERPGKYTLEGDMTVGRAITIAGGIKEGGQYGKVKVRRKREGEPGYDDIEIDLKGIIEGSVTEDMLLQPDDILVVERNKTFLVYGEIGRIGEYALEDGMTIFKAIIHAGGIGKWGSPKRIKVLRLKEDNAEFEIIKVNIKNVLDGDATADIILQPGDIVVVSGGIF